MADKLNPVPQAMKRVPVSRAKFYRLIKSGEIASVKVGGRRFVADSQIDEFIRRQISGSDAA